MCNIKNYNKLLQYYNFQSQEFFILNYNKVQINLNKLVESPDKLQVNIKLHYS